ncbi:YIP1 family protein [Maritimibacter sp. UBA3975]|uniref:YIP1 family protein n=1 Tax=Maritimibacter sp. UBA3975 TaxID=1946833 RepID=UPI000C0AA08E|nr:YIP1 family protein [Maritimibacter sp. UBA3975]MAM60547.1 YIP1 family protein [Maritimibacter sp.]|tara:strand:+ start:13275 stop:13769 length:495 start_codon:yes stop_codon:yes gene_type:complete
MSVVGDVLGAYRAPRSVFARRLGDTVREDRALAVLMVACILIFVAQAPRLQRVSIETGQELNPLLGGALFAWLFIVPLAAYAISGISHLALRLMGGKGSYFRARFALFWAMLVAAPMWLLWGLTVGFVGPGTAETLVGAIALAAFVIHWVLNLIVAESGGRAEA